MAFSPFSIESAFFSGMNFYPIDIIAQAIRIRAMPLLPRRSPLLVGLLLVSLTPSGCGVFRKVGLNYSEVKLPASQIVKDIPYWDSPEADPLKNRLDLYLPEGKKWPTLVFVHGGGWRKGDKEYKFVGADVYGNIGRYFASLGIGTAVISYRLMPKVDWRSQVLDVARAVHWVHENIARYGGNPQALFVAGHSSGAQLTVRISLDPAPLGSLGDSTQIICGMIPVSGAGYDLTDHETYEFAQKKGVLEKIFYRGNLPEGLRTQLSSIQFVSAQAPPSLILSAGHDPKELRHESKMLFQALNDAGAKTQLLSVPGAGHKTMVFALSHPDSLPTATIRVFLKTLTCGN